MSNSDVLAITYDLWIAGTKMGIDKKECVQSIEIKETVDGSDSATISIADPEFLYIEDNIFIENASVKIKLGWAGVTYRVTFSGYISAIDIDFASDGIPKLTVTCMDNTHIMNRKKKDNTFKDCTSADVVKKIVKQYGFTPVVDSSYSFTKQETITQSHQTDIDFITNLAGQEVYPFTARLVGNKFYYVKKGKLETPKMSLTYKAYPHTIISFSPKINKESKQMEISSSAVTTSNKSVSTTKGTTGSSAGSESASSNSASATSNGSSSSKKASGGYTYNPKTKTWTKN